MILTEAGTKTSHSPTNEFLEYCGFLDLSSLVQNEISTHKKSSAFELILILENISFIPICNHHAPEIITNSQKERVEGQKERGGYRFLIFGTIFPLFHIGLRSLPFFLPYI